MEDDIPKNIMVISLLCYSSWWKLYIESEICAGDNKTPPHTSHRDHEKDG